MPSPWSRLRSWVVANPLAVGEAGVLGVGVAATGIGALLLWAADLGVSAPEPVFFTLGAVLLAAGVLLPVVVAVRAAVDLYRTFAKDVAAAPATILRGVWRAGELFLVAVVLFFVLSSVLLASTPSGDLPNREARANLGAMVFVSGLMAAMTDVALAVAVSVRLAATAVYRVIEPPDPEAEPKPS